MGEIVSAAAAQSDAILLGRRTYQEFADFWPTQGGEDPMADYMNNTPKHVVSTTLDTLEWANSSLVNGDAAEGISRRLAPAFSPSPTDRRMRRRKQSENS